MSGEVAIIGAGMHPWGKWGRRFVEYGVAAAQEAGRKYCTIASRVLNGK